MTSKWSLINGKGKQIQNILQISLFALKSTEQVQRLYHNANQNTDKLIARHKDRTYISNNIHEKISPCWLAESMSINPKQCKNLKFFECTKTKLVQKVEIECKNLKLNWLTGKSRKRNSQKANQIFCFQIKRTPWMAQFIAQFFPGCVIRVRSFCSTISKLFHQSAWRNFFMYIINR